MGYCSDRIGRPASVERYTVPKSSRDRTWNVGYSTSESVEERDGDVDERSDSMSIDGGFAKSDGDAPHEGRE